MSAKLLSYLKGHLFTVISWVVTTLIVASMLGAAFWWTAAAATPAAQQAQPTAKADKNPPNITLPVANSASAVEAIQRQIELKTSIPADKPRYEAVDYTVTLGDSIFGIAEEFKIEPESLMWANSNTLQDSPDSLRIGQELTIPPTDGIYYQWQEGDTLESVAKEYKASVDDILNWPGNNIDLTDPEIKPGTWVMIPGGKREFIQWFIPTVARGASGTSPTTQSACPGGGLSGPISVWPADNHYLSGNDYWSGHLGIDIAAGEGAPIYAAGAGVVTMAQGGYNYGYGNVIQIDHGGGWSTLYAHLSQINVTVCQSVSAGQLIGRAGATGNAFGAHLHFEVRLNGGFVNPWSVLP
jgi:LysM repeat protein